jgi:hypothetical protein
MRTETRRRKPEGALRAPRRQLASRRHETHGLQRNSVPARSGARLPVNYQAALKAIATCLAIDECKDWADKCAALASYARQTRDQRLLWDAVRVQAWALRRCGVLLQRIPSARGVRTDKPKDGAVPKLTRETAAADAGLSERQRKTALRIASIPERKFKTLIDGDPPPSITRLAELGRQTSVSRGSIHPERARKTRAREMLRRFREFCDQNRATDLASSFTAEDAPALCTCTATLRLWLDDFITSLPRSQDADPAAEPSAPARVQRPTAQAPVQTIGLSHSSE